MRIGELRLQPATYSRRSRNVGCGPVDVLDADDERALPGERLEHAADRPERLVGRLGRRALERTAHPPSDEVAVGLRGDGLEDRLLAADRPDEVVERHEGEAVPVRQAAGREDAGLVPDRVEQLAREPRLADAGRAVDRDDPARLLAHDLGVLAAEVRELSRPADERRVEPARDRRRAGDRLDDAPRLDRQALPLGGHRGHRLELGRVVDEAARRLADQDLVGRRRLLESLRGVDRVARDECRAAVARDDLAAVDADADPQRRPALRRERLVQVRERPPHLEGGPHRPQRVVLVHLRDAEDRHHGVADELLDGAAVMLDRPAHRVVPGTEERAQRLRVEVLAEAGRVREIAEEDGDGPAGGCCGGGHPHSVAL